MTDASSPSRQKLWLAALKPPMYSVAIMPIIVGTAAAYGELGIFDPVTFALFLLSAVLILVWENLSNDVFDSETGIDINKPHSLVNLTQKKSLIFAIGNGCLGLGIAGIFAIALRQQDPTVLLLILLCCGLGYTYQGPPFRLGYQGLREILCFISFGPLAVGAAYYSQAQTWSMGSQIAGAVIGLTTSLVLFCSHFHQVEDDMIAGKRSPIVRLGTRQGAMLLPVVCLVSLGLIMVGIGLDYFPIWTLLSLVSIPTAVRLSQHVWRYHDQPERVSNAKFFAIGFHFWSGLLLGLGLVLPTGV
ncbi:MAG: 2-carboxy-1,4-naphthoquinone phytyltransferase [Leptolyngbyaceae cyanobacterium]